MFNRRKWWGKLVALCLVFALLFGCGGMMMPGTASAAATTSLTITKLASDGTTVLATKTVDYHWLEDSGNITVMGDGATHYYHQGPVFIDGPDEETEQALRWNPEEDTNVETKDMGAVMGTNVKDLCDLVGGMEADDKLRIKAVDGLKKIFAYKNVYQYSECEGPMVVCWYKDGKYPDTGYTEGMRLVWFADTSTNPWGINAFGNWDWHEAADPEYWYYYYQGSEKYPTTTGLSVQMVSELTIYSNQPAPEVSPTAAFTSDTISGTVPLTVSFTDESIGTAPLTYEWDFNNDGTVDSTEQNPTYEYTVAGTYSVKLTVTNAAGSDIEIKTDYITVTEPVAPVADFTADKTAGNSPLTVQFTDQSMNSPTSWAWDFDNDGEVDSTEQNPTYEYSAAGTYSVKLTATNAAGSNDKVKIEYITVATAGPKTWYVGKSGDVDYNTIQEAVTAASAGDTIIVKNGTYNENVTVDKSMVIQSENGADLTTVQAVNTGADVFKVTAENVTIDGFTVLGATNMGKSGIAISGTTSGSCTIINNKCSGNSQGISISVAKDNTVTNNTCTLSGRYGIYMSNTTGNSVTSNTCSNTVGSGYALYLADNADNNTVSGNTSDSNIYGIRVKAADSNTIFNNTISNNTYGIEIATGSVSNVFYLNNFIGNTSGQLSAGYGAVAGNFWNSPTEMPYSVNGTQYNGLVGNYWSNYTGADADGNGIGDTPYQTVMTDNDNYPLMGQWHDGVITIPAVAPTAAFTADTTSGTAPMTVNFTDESTGTAPLTYAWDFNNDGTVDSTDQNPTYEYSAAGTYSVKLTVSNTAGSDDEIKTDFITVTIPESKIWYVDDSGSADFTSIQAAVTAATAGDTIIVKDGTYTENVVVDKSLVIRSENGADLTIVKAANAGADVIRVTAANVTIDGFAASGATTMGKSGIELWSSNSSSCTIINNKCSGNAQGIAIEANAKDNIVSNNICTLNSKYGIYLTNATGNSITDNICSNNPGDSAYAGYAFYLADNADNNIVSGNTSDSNNIGIRVKAADSNTIYNNTFSNNNYGLEIATGSIGNVLYLNNFVDNTSGQLSLGYGAVAGNSWNSPTQMSYSFNGIQYTGQVGNYWSGYAGADADGNGIGDTPYQTVQTDNDNYPLMGQWQNGVITGSEAATFTVTFAVIPEDATVVVKDSETVEVTAEADGTYKLEAGTYSYTVSAEGYVEKTGTFAVADADQTVTIVLEPIVFTIDGSVVDTPLAFTLDQLKSMDVTTVKDSRNRSYTGVAINDLLSLLGTVNNDWMAIIKVKDGDQGPAKVSTYSNYVIAYERDGAPFNDGIGTETMHLQMVSEGGGNTKYVYGMIITEPETLTPPVVTADSSDNKVGQAIDINFPTDAAWETAITEITVNGSALTGDQYTVSAGNLNIAASVFTTAGDYAIVVKATGYAGATVTQTIVAAPISPNPVYTVAPMEDPVYSPGTHNGITTMTVNAGIIGLKYFAVNVAPVTPHEGNEAVVFTHTRNNAQMTINVTKADFDIVSIAQAGFNVLAGDVVRVYVVDDLTNSRTINPIILQ